MPYTNSFKLKTINLEKGYADVFFPGELTHHKMSIVAVDLFGGLTLKFSKKVDDNTMVYITEEKAVEGKWIGYSKMSSSEFYGKKFHN